MVKCYICIWNGVKVYWVWYVLSFRLLVARSASLKSWESQFTPQTPRVRLRYVCRRNYIVCCEQNECTSEGIKCNWLFELLQYDSTESAESVDKRNVGSFKRKLLEQLRVGSLRYVKRGHYTCPWHTRKPKCGTKKNLKQHARELSRTGTSARIRAQHEVLLVVLEENAQE
jgi:hypothetical protein